MKTVEIKIPEGFELKQEGNTYKVVEEEFKLKVGEDYVDINSPDKVVIDRVGDSGNLALFGSGFCKNILCSNPNCWRKATEEEVIKAFEKECVRKYGEDWKNIKIKECMLNKTSSLTNKCRNIVGIDKTLSGWIVWNKNGCLYYKGEWAEKLEESKFAENLGDIDRPWCVNPNGVVQGAYGYRNKNHVPTENIAEGQLALSQLLSFRHDVWEKEGKPENTSLRHGIFLHRNKIESNLTNVKSLFQFKKEETAKWFLETHKELLTEYFNKLIK